MIIVYQGYEGEQALNVSGDQEEIAVLVKIQPQNIYLTPQFLIAVAFGVVVTVVLVIVLLKRRD